MKRIASRTMGLAVLVLIGCTTLDPERLTDISIRQPIGPLALKPTYEIYLIREDLVRATHSESRSSYTNGKLSTYSVQVPNAYHELAIDLGNGIFMDYNNNLFVDLLCYYRLDVSMRMHILRTPKGFSFENTATYDYEDGVYRTENGIIWTEIKQGNQIDLEWGPFKTKKRIEITENGIVFASRVLGADVVKSATLVSATELEVKGFWKDLSFTLVSPDQIQMGRYFEMNRYPDHISIIYKGIFGMTTERTFVKTEAGFLFFTPENFGVEVMKNGNIISVYRNGKMKVEYQIGSE